MSQRRLAILLAAALVLAAAGVKAEPGDVDLLEEVG
jgi:hypothetical protein